MTIKRPGLPTEALRALDILKKDDLIKVGDKEEREVSPLNHELYTHARKILEEGTGDNAYHIGWSGVGNYIDWLEAKYDIKAKQ